MTGGKTAGAASVALLVLLALVTGRRALERDVEPASATSPVRGSSAATHEGLLYGRITTRDGAVYEGRLRWGGDQEALWGSTFNGFKDENAWAVHVPPDELPRERISIGGFGIEVAGWERPTSLRRPFMARFGDIAHIERRGNDLLVTLKSGTVSVLDRMAADDFGDGVRVWDGEDGFVDLGERQMRTIELLPGNRIGDAPYPLHGTVRTSQGDFTGLIEWDRQESLGPDELLGQTTDGVLSLPFDTIRSVARQAGDSSLVTLADDSEIVLLEIHQGGRGNRGIYVDDSRYGRVLISWDAFERVDFSPGGTGPTYDDFPPGHALGGSVTTRSGLRLDGRLVYDLDESETTETLDAPSGGVDYTLLFGLIASIALPGPDEADGEHVRVTLHSGEELRLERSGDLGDGNGGMLIFVDGRERPEYVAWTDVAQIDLDRPAAMYPPGDPR